ncbi:hypothetical protein PG999_007604 [Apiospora kogelbergensis]|uniref:Apple domain-containing protein n=1 Tax=Apiospora kogelbergensis TaxID=1337665 RepID=A0AAW0QLP8_9PEZI
MVQMFLFAALAIIGTNAQESDVKTLSGTRAATTNNVECKSLFGSGGTAPKSLPTVTASNLVLRTTTTEAPTTMPSYLTLNGPTSTLTLLKATSRVDYIATETSDVKVVRPNGPTATFATATFATTECTNGGAAPQTVTVYSGAYTPVPGQATTLPVSYPTQVVCQTTQNVLVVSYHTVLSGVATITSFPTTTISDRATATMPSTFTWGTTTVWKTTVTQTSTTLAAAARTQVVRTACAPTVTKTYAAKCAPTNLVNNRDGQGLWWNYLDGNATSVVARLYDGDASGCCQACVDNKDCAAMEMNSRGLCSLYFDHDASYDAVCGSVGFTYRSLPDIWPGQGIWAQSGCGEARWLAPGQ